MKVDVCSKGCVDMERGWKCEQGVKLMVWLTQSTLQWQKASLSLSFSLSVWHSFCTLPKLGPIGSTGALLNSKFCGYSFTDRPPLYNLQCFERTYSNLSFTLYLLANEICKAHTEGMIIYSNSLTKLILGCAPIRIWNKLAKLRRKHASQVHFAKIHLDLHFGKTIYTVSQKSLVIV